MNTQIAQALRALADSVENEDPAADAATAADVAALRDEIATLTARIDQAVGALTDAQQTGLGDGVVSIKHAAEWLDISPRTVQTMTRTGDLPTVRVGSSPRIPVAVLRRYLDE